jgi:hypothetical protein
MALSKMPSGSIMLVTGSIANGRVNTCNGVILIAVRITYQIGAAVFLFTGRLNVKVAPIASGLFSAHILPP